MAIIDHNHPEAGSTVVRRLADGQLVGFLKRINTDAGWLERYQVEDGRRVATADGKPQVVREVLAGQYEVVTGVPPYIRVKDSTGHYKTYRRADVIPASSAAPSTAAPATPAAPAAPTSPPQIKVSGHVYVREDLATKTRTASQAKDVWAKFERVTGLKVELQPLRDSKLFNGVINQNIVKVVKQLEAKSFTVKDSQYNPGQRSVSGGGYSRTFRLEPDPRVSKNITHIDLDQ